MVDVEHILAENAKRHKRINVVYDPSTGEGCIGERVCLKVKDAPIPVMYLPKPMMDSEVCKLLVRHGSIAALYKAQKQELTEDEFFFFWVNFCELRIKHDYEFYAFMYQIIEGGEEQGDIPFKLRRAQREFLKVLEGMRLVNKPICAIVLKARQMGLSTLTQLYMEWIQSVHRKNWHSVICAHLSSSSITIRAMYDKVIENKPPIDGRKHTMTRFKNTESIKFIPERDCRITIGTAQEPDSVRGQNPKMAHFSEVAYYPNTTKKATAQLIGSITGAMKLLPYTVQVYESTARGVGDYFHAEWLKAKKGESAFSPVFLAWYYNDTYTSPVEGGLFYNNSGKESRGDIADFVRSLDDYELNLFLTHTDCTLENIHWYRQMNARVSTDEIMKQEYPSDDIEAFQDSGMPAFRYKQVEALRSACSVPISIGDIVADCLPTSANTEPGKRKGILSGVRFVEDVDAMSALLGTDPKTREKKDRNKLRIWEFPDSTINVSNRYVVVFDPQKGISEKADYGVIAVFDRYWMMEGGKPEVVAEWRGRIDKDIAVWVAAQIAKYYNNALLVVESNTYDSDFKEDDAEFVFDTIADYYDNLYSRTPADKIREGAPVKYGFHTSRSTKPIIYNNYVTMLRERGYVERNSAALDEARVYEQKENGRFGAKDGYHDDILMTRMIGCYICYELPIPVVIDENKSRRINSRVVGESSF